MSNPFQHSPEAASAYAVLIENSHGLDQTEAGALAIKVVEQLRRSFRFEPLRARNKQRYRKSEAKPAVIYPQMTDRERSMIETLNPSLFTREIVDLIHRLTGVKPGGKK